MRSGSSCYLALDQGGHSSRALVFDQAGKLLSSAQVGVATNNIGTNRVEQYRLLRRKIIDLMGLLAGVEPPPA